MNDAASLHLKLDRITAKQDEQDRKLDAIDQSLAALTAGMTGLVPLLGTHREMLQQVLDELTKESPSGSDLHNLLARIEATLGNLSGAIHSINGLLRDLPAACESATIDGVRLATGGGVDIRTNGHG